MKGDWYQDFYIVYKDTDNKFIPMCCVKDPKIRSTRYYGNACDCRSKREASAWVEFFNRTFPDKVFQKRAGECPCGYGHHRKKDIVYSYY